METTHFNKDLLREQYEAMTPLYANAIRTAVAQIENIRNELLPSPDTRNPITDDYSRVKDFDSALEKCQRKGFATPTIEDIRNNVHDIAGIRIICHYLDDIERIDSIIRQSPGIAVMSVKDYIAYPKPSGYASLHLKTMVQISSFFYGTQVIPLEIQIRTQLMDTWAQTEHRVKYKSETGPTPEIDKMLVELAAQFRRYDELMVQIRKTSGEE